ncbi:hypothetical protein GCM10012289_66860 [Nonomuraea cavernae]|uniref:Uncharacterized protein n=1 Tax=Nonomuraea cavernae TaxID=2045107 RepID=A0A918DSA0_9ACTN|nr:hypothetical protein GCM10012289_66860 [Nonomuraea cavernae]
MPAGRVPSGGDVAHVPAVLGGLPQLVPDQVLGLHPGEPDHARPVVPGQSTTDRDTTTAVPGPGTTDRDTTTAEPEPGTTDRDTTTAERGAGIAPEASLIGGRP